MLALVVTPSRRLVLERLEAGAAGAEAGPWAEPALGAQLEAAFAESAAAGLLALATAAQEAVLPPAFAWWRKLPERFLTELCHLPDGEGMPLLFPPPDGFLAETLEARPPFPGAEYVDADMVAGLWDALADAARAKGAAAGRGVSEWVHSLGGSWGRVGRVWFHLAENPRGGTEQPFAFMATYSTKALAGGKVQFRQLGKALEEYAGAGNRKALANLLTPVEGAAKRLAWVQELVASGEIFHPLAWSAAEARGFIDAIPALEECGVLTRLPQKWLRGPARVKVNVKVGAGPADGLLGKNALLDFDAALALDGEPLTAAEAKAILSGTGGLLMLRGQWVQVDKASLEKALSAWRRWEDGVDFRQALRLVAGLDGDEARSGGWVEVQAGAWLAERLESLRAPERIPGGGAERIVGLEAKLRPYQEAGVRWLRFVTGLGLGGCLADDMGLGKTVQVLALLLAERNERNERNGRNGPNGPHERNGRDEREERRRAADGTPVTTLCTLHSTIDNPPALLVVPASLLSNWLAEAAKFAPSLRIRCAHPAFDGAEMPADLAEFDAVLTTYGMLHRTPWLAATEWGLAVLDEAQAIKNPGTRQTRAVKQIHARTRLAMTGTPVENRLGDLWSIFDFLNPGLLGSQKEFDALVYGLEKRGGYAPLRRLVSPYILRRLKTDKTVIADLPDKVEAKAWCGLSRRQAALYAELTEKFRADLEEAEGIARRGLVLAYLMRFKQLCNHPSQWLSDGVFEPADSGKFGRLRAIAEEVAQRQEKLLVFTQFKEMTEPLHRFLGGIFGRPGLVLHGGVAVGKRRDLVVAFQDEAGPPYFVLSLKAGGTGLNLTAASHVVHFDRWWNPAVEDQATDRAFRIGQKRNVMVHKFICRGTFEEKIDAMIEAKQAVAREVVGDGGGEAALTELDNRQILELVKLDIKSATAEEE